jgi:hypothetical protein
VVVLVLVVCVLEVVVVVVAVEVLPPASAVAGAALRHKPQTSRAATERLRDERWDWRFIGMDLQGWLGGVFEGRVGTSAPDL